MNHGGRLEGCQLYGVRVVEGAEASPIWGERRPKPVIRDNRYMNQGACQTDDRDAGARYIYVQPYVGGEPCRTVCSVYPGMNVDVNPETGQVVGIELL